MTTIDVIARIRREFFANRPDGLKLARDIVIATMLNGRADYARAANRARGAA